MAKKKKKQNPAKQVKNKMASNPLRQQEEAVRRVYHSYMKDVNKRRAENSELIRRADIVWVQANAISHAYYYKILDETRKHSIPVRYFSYASALKCAEQLAEQDMKEAQK